MNDVSRDTPYPRTHGEELRHPGDVIANWQGAMTVGPESFDCEVTGAWWDILKSYRITLLVSREYEHLLISLHAERTAFVRVPHPSGIAVDTRARRIHVACSRNPNQLLEFAPIRDTLTRDDCNGDVDLEDAPLIPIRLRFLPGCLYLHDLALIGHELFGNSVGQNAIIRLNDRDGWERVWWPNCIDRLGPRGFQRNFLQLNSIGATDRLATSYFSASAENAGTRYPGDPDFPVDRQGVVFSATTGEPVVRGLTRPHSVRVHENRIWLDNSGYGEVGYAEGDRFCALARLPGWTRGLAFHGPVVFVGTSRVLSRFRNYAPGLDVETSRCGIFALDVRTGEILGSLTWLNGDQIFAIECVPDSFTKGFPFPTSERSPTRETTTLFYAYRLSNNEIEER